MLVIVQLLYEQDLTTVGPCLVYKPFRSSAVNLRIRESMLSGGHLWCWLQQEIDVNACQLRMKWLGTRVGGGGWDDGYVEQREHKLLFSQKRMNDGRHAQTVYSAGNNLTDRFKRSVSICTEKYGPAGEVADWPCHRQRSCEMQQIHIRGISP